MDIQKTNTEFEAISNQLFTNKMQQKELQQEEKELKSNLLPKMPTNLHKVANGSIEKIKRKPKRIYDSDKLRAVLLKRGMPENVIKDIIKSSTRRINVPEHLSVKVRRPK